MGKKRIREASARLLSAPVDPPLSDSGASLGKRIKRVAPCERKASELQAKASACVNRRARSLRDGETEAAKRRITAGTVRRDV